MVKNKNEDQSMVVEFSVKELFTDTKTAISNLSIETNRKLDSVSTALNNKSEKSQMDRLESMMRDMERNGCGHAQEAMAVGISLRTRLEKLENDAVSSKAVFENTENLLKEQKNSKLQWLAIIATFLLVLAEVLKPLFK